MKKILVVLTILVLVAGFAFAAVAGSVTAKYVVDFDAIVIDELAIDRTTAGYSAPNSDIEATFTLDTQDGAVKGGDADGSKPYALVEVKANIAGYYAAYADHIAAKAPATNTLKFTFKVATFKLVGADWEIDLLSSKGAATDFAKSAIDSVTFHKDAIEENTAAFTYNNAVDYVDGISATYKGYTVGAGFKTTGLTQRNAAISLEAKTPEYAFGDVTFQVGAGFSQTGYKLVSEATKAGYAYYGSLNTGYMADVFVPVNNYGYAKLVALLGEDYEDLSTAEAREAAAVALKNDEDFGLIVGDGFTTADYATYVEMVAAMGDGDEPATRFYRQHEYDYYVSVPAVAAVEDFGGVRKFALSAKVAYGEMASLAIDLGKASDENEVKFDLAAKVAVAPVTVDVYFGNYVAAKDAKEVAATVTAKNLLSAKAVVALADLNEDLPVTVTVTAIDLLNRYDNIEYHGRTIENLIHVDKDSLVIDFFALHPFGKIVNAEATTTIVKDFELTASYNDMFNKDWAYAAVKAVYTGLEKFKIEAGMKYNFKHVVLGANAGVTYTTDLFEVKGGIEYVGVKNEAAAFGLSASIASETLVDGATLKAAWSGAQFTKYSDAAADSYNDLGKITLSCAVEF